MWWYWLWLSEQSRWGCGQGGGLPTWGWCSISALFYPPWRRVHIWISHLSDSTHLHTWPSGMWRRRVSFYQHFLHSLFFRRRSQPMKSSPSITWFSLDSIEFNDVPLPWAHHCCIDYLRKWVQQWKFHWKFHPLLLHYQNSISFNTSHNKATTTTIISFNISLTFSFNISKYKINEIIHWITIIMNLY